MIKYELIIIDDVDEHAASDVNAALLSVLDTHDNIRPLLLSPAAVHPKKKFPAFSLLAEAAPTRSSEPSHPPSSCTLPSSRRSRGPSANVSVKHIPLLPRMNSTMKRGGKGAVTSRVPSVLLEFRLIDINFYKVQDLKFQESQSALVIENFREEHGDGEEGVVLATGGFGEKREGLGVLVCAGRVGEYPRPTAMLTSTLLSSPLLIYSATWCWFLSWPSYSRIRSRSQMPTPSACRPPVRFLNLLFSVTITLNTTLTTTLALTDILDPILIAPNVPSTPSRGIAIQHSREQELPAPPPTVIFTLFRYLTYELSKRRGFDDVRVLTIGSNRPASFGIQFSRCRLRREELGIIGGGDGDGDVGGSVWKGITGGGLGWLCLVLEVIFGGDAKGDEGDGDVDGDVDVSMDTHWKTRSCFWLRMAASLRIRRRKGA
ncbi:hypothetical protein CPB84DRAFT_1854189 [Gymnopilus junonius]|uniref:Uncharacterized protein n=1 Tax=Gymnopilus junonius TaxID=109634 RepID=A0A9P5N9J8_GYMJU|nr:hypothetical protein CPB84DRAFT_1854189 [Gymnopilus junonius]